MWWMLPAAIGAVSSMKSAERKADQQKANNLAQAEMTRYSPWTGMTGKLDTSYTPGAFEAGLSGGLQGLGMAQGFGMGGMGGGGSPQMPANSTMTAGTPWDQMGKAQQPNLFSRTV